MASSAIEGGQSLVDHLPIVQLGAFDAWQGGSDLPFLLGAKVKVRCRITFAKTALHRVEIGHGYVIFLRETEIVMTLRATEFFKLHLSLCHQSGIDLEGLKHWNRLIRDC